MAFPTQSFCANGTTQYLTAADSASLSPTGDQTHEGWVKFTSLPTAGNEMAIWAKYDTGTGQRSIACSLGNSAGTYYFQSRNSSTGANNVGGTTVNWTGANTGQWHYMRFVYTAAAGTMDIYVDDLVTKLGQSTGLFTSVFNSTALYRLGQTDFTTFNFAGSFGVWRVWSAVHTTSDACTVYGSAQTNMAAEWSLDNVLTDASGNANTLTNNGTGTFATNVSLTCTVNTTPAVIASTKTVGASSGTSMTQSFTIPTGYTNLGLVVYCFNTTGNSFTSMTYNGVSMTSGAVNAPGFSFRSQYFYLANPAVGANNIVLNWSGADTSVSMLAVALTGCNQSSMVDVEGYTAVNQVATISKSVTTTVNNDLVLAGFAIQPTSSARTESGSQCREIAAIDTLGATNYYGEVASLPKATAGAQAMALSWTTNRDADALVVAIKFAAPINSGFFMAASQ